MKKVSFIDAHSKQVVAHSKWCWAFFEHWSLVRRSFNYGQASQMLGHDWATSTGQCLRIAENTGAACFRHTAVRSQKAVTAYFSSKQILPFGFAERHTWPESWPTTRLSTIQEWEGIRLTGNQCGFCTQQTRDVAQCWINVGPAL